jgi:hypothetical protein
MKKILIALFLLLASTAIFPQNLQTRFEKSNGTESPPYPEIITWWQNLAKQSDNVKMMTMGMTDAGYPLHLILISADKDFNIQSIHKKNKRIILINNGIHSGEPDGIDACMLLAKDLISSLRNGVWITGIPDVDIKNIGFPNNIVLAIIPVYNIGGCLNRSPNYRIDQNGPTEKGFRGNSENLDLNRDFIKCDSKDARAFTEIFHLLDPDVFVDNHVSDGADYQHVMTLICSQHNKLGGAMGEFMNKEFEPGLYDLMGKRGYDLVPYVNAFGDKPENGWEEFWDSPRYSSGYAALWNTFSFIPETHMLKPYKQRVESTVALMKSFIEFTAKNSDRIAGLRKNANEAVKTQISFPIRWQLDSLHFKEIQFKGYISGMKTSDMSGQPRLYYDRSRPFEKKVHFLNVFTPIANIKKPKAYIIPQGWWKVIELLKLNHVEMRALKTDTTLDVETYHIDNFKSSQRPYESHHPNSDVKVLATTLKTTFRKGDWFIPMNQAANRFILETLEPQAEDSYFTWNFFDGILGQKEGYSGYAFEDIASAYVNQHPLLQKQLADKRNSDSTFAKSAGAQLNFVYQHSPYFEPDYLRYPVYRVLQ